MNLKAFVVNKPVLAFYDVNKPVEIQCDASKDGLGAVLIQAGRPVAYSSRSCSDTEKRYAQIKKKCCPLYTQQQNSIAIYLEKKLPSTTTTNHWKWLKTVKISTNEHQ